MACCSHPQGSGGLNLGRLAGVPPQYAIRRARYRQASCDNSRQCSFSIYSGTRIASSLAAASRFPIPRTEAIASSCFGRGRAWPDSHLYIDWPVTPISAPKSAAESPSFLRVAASRVGLNLRCTVSVSWVAATDPPFAFPVAVRFSSRSSVSTRRRSEAIWERY